MSLTLAPGELLPRIAEEKDSPTSSTDDKLESRSPTTDKSLDSIDSQVAVDDLQRSNSIKKPSDGGAVVKKLVKKRSESIERPLKRAESVERAKSEPLKTTSAEEKPLISVKEQVQKLNVKSKKAQKPEIKPKAGKK